MPTKYPFVGQFNGISITGANKALGGHSDAATRSSMGAAYNNLSFSVLSASSSNLTSFDRNTATTQQIRDAIAQLLQLQIDIGAYKQG